VLHRLFSRAQEPMLRLHLHMTAMQRKIPLTVMVLKKMKKRIIVAVKIVKMKK
jgi:hypothetical protein